MEAQRADARCPAIISIAHAQICCVQWLPFSATIRPAMKNFIATFGLLLAGVGSSSAFQTAQSVTATPITVVPFTISASGNYYLANNVNVVSGVGITVAASGVTIDLNGHSITATGGSTGISVVNHDEVTIQNGDIDDFSANGKYGIVFNGAANGQNQKNVVRNVNFDNDSVGVLILRGSIDTVEHCNFDGGFAGIYDIACDGGDRFQADNSQNQTFGIVSVSSPSSGNLIEDCLFANETVTGFFAANNDDKFRLCTAVNGTLNIGGTRLGF